ncbi:glycosyltransferase [Streptomyces sp. NPDC060064]|uniref:glycosyltransferase n=1 Tax=Streptomyces sp. NPDC060064 TaxID=3347049 RepID=UPI0036AA9D38
MPEIGISVVVPCYEENEVIEAFHAALTAELEPVGEPYEICYVDDGSGAGTAQRLRELAATAPQVRCTSFSRNFGNESAPLRPARVLPVAGTAAPKP